MKQSDKNFLIKFCQAVSRHRVFAEDGMCSVAFGGNCGIFAIKMLEFLDNHHFPFDDWKIGFIFIDVDSLDEIYEDDDNLDAPDLNHVLMKIDDEYFDGSGQANPSEWYGRCFDKDDDWADIVQIVRDFTDMTVTDDKLDKILRSEWKKLGGDKLYK